MNSCVVENRATPVSSGPWALLRKVGSAFAELNAPASKLDLEAMPDQLKRDIGLLDGRDPYREDDLTR